jgi:glucosamine-6-phosphate deaminase
VRIEIFRPEDWAAKVADRFEAFLAAHPRPRISLPTGTTPVPFYVELVRRRIDMSDVDLFLLDEFGGIPPDHPARCEAMLRRDLLDRLDLPPKLFAFDVAADDVGAEAIDFEETIAAGGGLHLVVLGLGGNGHVGLNEPGSTADSPTRVVDLAPGTIAATERYGDAVRSPEWGVTLGMRTILSARAIWLIVTGSRKAEILRRTIESTPDPEIPASLLSLNPRTTIYADDAAAPR